VRLQLHALAYNLGNFMRTLAMPKIVETWSMTSLREKLIKIGLLAIFDDHAASRKRRPSRSRPARPYMVRFSILRRLI
jgi:DDE family transposase